jgi:hypothetical protein
MNHEAAQTAVRSCTQWRKASYSWIEGVECVEITTELTGWVGVRDSKLGADTPVLVFTTAEWRTVLASARAGQLDV